MIENALVDQRFCDNPLVMGAPDIRFYAGAPLHSTKGYRIGTLCLIDSQPRSFSSKQRSMLKDLAATVEALIQAEELSNERLGKLTAQLPGVVYQFQRFASGKITFLLAHHKFSISMALHLNTPRKMLAQLLNESILTICKELVTLLSIPRIL
ncbi:GAF domain-containing protein [Vibrio metschnikovii]